MISYPVERPIDNPCITREGNLRYHSGRSFFNISIECRDKLDKNIRSFIFEYLYEVMINSPPYIEFISYFRNNGEKGPQEYDRDLVLSINEHIKKTFEIEENIVYVNKKDKSATFNLLILEKYITLDYFMGHIRLTK